MKISDYPAQEPLSALGRSYHDRALAAGAGIAGADEPYGDDPYQRLSIHRAARPSGDVLVFFHGGGWTNGYKEWMDFMAPALVAQGVTFVSAGYRLAPQHLFPAGFDDAARAIAWVHGHIRAHGGDAKRVFVGGHSAGGQLAALLAVTRTWRSDHGVPDDVLRGCLPVSGVYRFDARSGLTMRPRFLGPTEPHDAAHDASPLLALERDVAPPFFLTWGSRDFPHLITQAGEMADALRASGVAADTHVLEGCDHFEASLACGDPDSGWPARAAAWMHAVGRTHTSTTTPGGPR